MPQPIAFAMAEPMDLDENEAEVRPPGPPVVHLGAAPANPQGGPSPVPHVVANSTLDLEAYANNYSGFMKIRRLAYVAEHCPALRRDALNTIVQFVQTHTHNTKEYHEAHQKLADMALDRDAPHVPLSNGPDLLGGGGAAAGPGAAGGNQNDVVPPAPGAASAVGVKGGNRSSSDQAVGVFNSAGYDAAWVEQTQKRAMCKLEKLDSDLKHYKGNSIKESIRRGQDDLGEHYLDTGDLTNALKCFSRARDYCTSNKHVVQMCFNVIKVSVYLNNWSLVGSYVNRAEQTPELAQPAPTAASKEASTTRLAALAKLRAAAGLSDLATKKYKSAAKHFLQVALDHFDYPEVLSAQNVAEYGALCALATFDRQELQRGVIGNATFKQLLELTPWLLDVIRKFNESEYAQCLRALEHERDNLMLDLYLAPHLDALYTQIRNRGLVQYFSPYLTADMRLMAHAFNTTPPQLEDELSQLILDGQVKARIDSQNKVLHAKDVDQRSSTYADALAAGRALQRRARALLLRAAVQRAKISVKPPPREGAGGGAGPSVAAEAAVTPANSGQSSPLLY